MTHSHRNSRGRTARTEHGKGVAGFLARDWQVVTALTLLLAGAVGLFLSDYGKTECALIDTPTIPNHGSSAIPDHLSGEVDKASDESGLPANVLAAQIEAESAWNPDAHSKAGAKGIAQFTDDTWETWGEGDPMNEKDAIAAQGRYMKFLREQARGYADNEDQVNRYALAGYNAGPNAMKKAEGVPDIQETKLYVDKIMKLSDDKYAQCSC